MFKLLLPARRSKRGICYGDVAGWPAGWLGVSVTRRYFIKTAKPILKLFRPSGSPIILVSSDPAPIPNSKGNSFSRGVKYTCGGKNWQFSCDFPSVRFSMEIAVYLRKRCEIGRWLLWNVNRKSWVPDWITFSMTLIDPLPGFQGHCILTIEISQNLCILWTKLLNNTNRKPYTIFRMVTLSMTLSDLWHRFQDHDIFRHGISQWHEIEP